MPDNKPKSAPRRLRIRTLLKVGLLAVIIAVLIPLLQILIPAVEHRDELIALLNYSDDCQAPCVLGIQPGETMVGKVIKLYGDEADFTVRTYGQNGDIRFNLNSGGVGAVTVLYFNGRVEQIMLETQFSYTAILLAYGYPAWQWHIGGSYLVVYLDKELFVNPAQCTDIYNFFRASVGLSFVPRNDLYDALEPYQFGYPVCYDLF